MRKQRITISVIGGHESSYEVDQLANDIGIFIANMECVLVCGGLSGTMEACSKGAKSVGGSTIGILPGIDKADANKYIDIALPTSIGFSRNVIVACSGDIVVALPGSNGTRCEISYALVYKRPVIDLGNWGIEGMIDVNGFDEAKVRLEELITDLRKQ
ncbi:MAG: hypothetical protein ACI9F2_000582 [Lysobacterales bacterium]|jgi:uncharacterized protein (TIGR00725 family)